MEENRLPVVKLTDNVLELSGICTLPLGPDGEIHGEPKLR